MQSMPKVNFRFDFGVLDFHEFKMATIINDWVGYGTC